MISTFEVSQKVSFLFKSFEIFLLNLQNMTLMMFERNLQAISPAVEGHSSGGVGLLPIVTVIRIGFGIII
jgi:hypothetical protein